MQECYKMFTAVTHQIMMICHFCHICCVHHMGMSSTCVLNYAMPSLHRCLTCIFVINVVTSTSLQSSLRDIAVFRDLGFCKVLCLLLFWCHVNMMLQWDPCLFWVSSVRMFWTYGYAISIPGSVCICGVAWHVLILLYFCYKMFLADCLRVNQFCHGCCRLSKHPMSLLFSRLG